MSGTAEGPAKTLSDGTPVTDDHREINPLTGQQKAYVVLSDAERAKGFVRPVRLSYVHVGVSGPTGELRDLTEEEQQRHRGYGYVKYEPYPPERSPVLGKYWTQQQLDAVGRRCGAVTTMARAIAETYARDPKFYGSTFCVRCKDHFAVGEDGEFVWDDNTSEKVGT